MCSVLDDVIPATAGSDFSNYIVINTDGSALNPGKPNAAAGVGVWFGHEDTRNVGAPLGPGKQTNQRAELMAVKIALDRVPPNKSVLIRSDSMYAIQGLTENACGWQRESWKTAKGLHMENENLVQKIQELLRVRSLLRAETKFYWVKGHSGDLGNEAADKLAGIGSRKALSDLRERKLASRNYRKKRMASIKAKALPVISTAQECGRDN
ncbi:Ribonuclease H [Ascochyta lentis]